MGDKVNKMSSSKYSSAYDLEDDEYDSESSYSDIDLDLSEDFDSIKLPVVEEKQKTGPIMYALFYLMGAVIVLSSTTFHFLRNSINKIMESSETTECSSSIHLV